MGGQWTKSPTSSSDVNPRYDRSQSSSHSYRMRQMEEDLEKMRSALTQKENEVESLIQRMRQQEEHLEKMRYALTQKEKEVESLKQRMRQQEEHLEEMRSALVKKDEELKSFKDRVAGEVALSMKTGKGHESMNSPVSKTRLTEMYEELWRQWPNIKNHLKSNQEHPENVKAWIQNEFKEAMEDMEENMKKIDEVFGLKELSSGSSSEKVQQYRQSTVQNLQLALYHSGKKHDDQSKTLFSGHEGEKPLDVEEYWSKCYRLGCLMALNDPPLQPDWEHPNPGMGDWNFFPRNITAASGKEAKQIQHQDHRF